MEKPLTERIAADLKKAMKQRDVRKTSVLRMINADIKNFEIAKQKPAMDEDILRILGQQAKKHQDSIAQFTAGNRPDLTAAETEELQIIQSYLPQPLTSEELDRTIDRAVKESVAVSSADFGKVMKILMPMVAGRAPGQTVSQKLKARLETHNK